MAFLSEEREYIDSHLMKLFKEKSDNPPHKVALHLIKAGGKRIRPIISILSAEAVGGRRDEALPAALAVEILHTASLIHDDIIDGDIIRRGRKAVHVKFGIPLSLIGGDLLFSEAFRLATCCKNLKSIEVLANACIKMCKGEALELQIQGQDKVDEKLYFEIIEMKTASLIEAAAKVGAILGGGSKFEVEALSKYGRLLGIAYQLRDDILGLIGRESNLGKPLDKHPKKLRKTLASIYALNHYTRKNHGDLPFLLNQHTIQKHQVLKFFEEIGAIRYVSNKSQIYMEEAKNALKCLGSTKARSKLLKIADFTVTRRR